MLGKSSLGKSKDQPAQFTYTDKSLDILWHKF